MAFDRDAVGDILLRLTADVPASADVRREVGELVYRDLVANQSGWDFSDEYPDVVITNRHPATLFAAGWSMGFDGCLLAPDQDVWVAAGWAARLWAEDRDALEHWSVDSLAWYADSLDNASIARFACSEPGSRWAPLWLAVAIRRGQQLADTIVAASN